MASNYINIPAFGSASWKSPVPTAINLPTNGNSLGDARVADDTSIIYVWNGTMWVAAGGGSGGTVTSVGLAAPSIFSVSGSPVTTAGTLTLSLNTEVSSSVFAGPASGSPAAPTFRALTASDIPVLPYVTSVTASSPVTSSGGTTPNIAINSGNLIDVGTDGITITGGTGAVLGSGTTISQQAASSTNNGYLSSTDWNTFNNKQSAGNYITALTGDVTASGPGSSTATIANNAVTLSKMANLAANSFIGNNTGSAITPIALSQAQSTALLNLFTSSLQGLVPSSGGGTTNFLRADGIFSAPPTFTSPLTTKGDLFGFSTVNARIPVGGTDGIALTVDSTNANGVSYATNFVRVGSNPTTFLFDNGTTAELSLKGSASQATVINMADGLHFNWGGPSIGMFYNDGTWQSVKQMVSGASTLARPAFNLNFSNSGLHFPSTNNVSLVTNSTNGLNQDANQNIKLPSSLAFGYQRVSATTGGSTTINNNISVLVLHATGTLIAYTVTMPATPIDGQQIIITADQSISTLTLSGNSGQTVIGAPTALPLGSGINYIWIATDSEWYPI